MTKSVIAGADSVSGPSLTPTDPELAFEPVRVPAKMPPTLFMVVDTEEEFDWHAPFSRSSTGVTAIAALDNLHGVVDRYRVRPMYVIDYPVATKVEAYSVIREIVESGRGQVGAHLHPWVTPPFTEEVNGPNSFACNLGAALEEAKLRNLTEAIEANVGVRPDTYKAGRYGLGRTTVRILQRLGFDVDISINPLMDYRPVGRAELRSLRCAAVSGSEPSAGSSRCPARLASRALRGAPACRCIAPRRGACCVVSRPPGS